MLNRINNLMYYSMFAANVFLMLLGCVIEYEPATIIVLCLGLALSLALCLFFKVAKQICLTSEKYTKQIVKKGK